MSFRADRHIICLCICSQSEDIIAVWTCVELTCDRARSGVTWARGDGVTRARGDGVIRARGDGVTRARGDGVTSPG